jgi:hypothetical protein
MQVNDATGVIDRNHSQGVMAQRFIEPAGGKIRICNLKGQVVYERDHAGTIDGILPELLKARGTYFVQYFPNGKGVVTRKILRF